MLPSRTCSLRNQVNTDFKNGQYTVPQEKSQTNVSIFKKNEGFFVVILFFVVYCVILKLFRPGSLKTHYSFY